MIYAVDHIVYVITRGVGNYHMCVDVGCVRRREWRCIYMHINIFMWHLCISTDPVPTPLPCSPGYPSHKHMYKRQHQFLSNKRFAERFYQRNLAEETIKHCH